MIRSEVQKRPNAYTSNRVRINYKDIDMKASIIDTEAVLIDTKYMGSLSTLNKIPDEWWRPDQIDKSNYLNGYNCAKWGRKLVYI